MTIALRILRTPLFDLVRGRVSRYASVQVFLAEAQLPEEIRQSIEHLTRRTGLRLVEKLDVAEELAAHFADAMASGQTAQQVMETFGDWEQAARLIRRSKIRNRSAMWHFFRALRWMAAVVIGGYVLMGVWLLSGSPSTQEDVLANYTSPSLAIPEQERAMRVYLEVLHALSPENQALLQRADVRGKDQDSQQIRQLIESERVLIERVREATRLPALGEVLSSKLADPATNYDRLPQNVDNHRALNTASNLLTSDLFLALSQQDIPRALANLEAIERMAKQTASSGIFTQASGAFAEVAACAVAELIPYLNAAQLRNQAHLLASLEIKLDLSFLRQFVLLDLQRTFSDDGEGNGRPTLAYLNRIVPEKSRGVAPPRIVQTVGLAALPWVAATTTKSDVLAEFDALYDIASANFAKPYRLADWSAYRARVYQINTDAPTYARFAILQQYLHLSWQDSHAWMELRRCRRDAVVAALALELYNRRIGRYPSTLDELVPSYLPSLPIDPLNGEPLRYRLLNGSPVLYSVGDDRDDDGGRLPLTRQQQPDTSYIPDFGSRQTPPRDGDWIAYPIAP